MRILPILFLFSCVAVFPLGCAPSNTEPEAAQTPPEQSYKTEESKTEKEPDKNVYNSEENNKADEVYAAQTTQTPAQQPSEREFTSKDFFTVPTPKGWDYAEDKISEAFDLYGADYRPENWENWPNNKQLVIYMDYFPKNNQSAPTIEYYVAKSTTIVVQTMGRSSTQPEPIIINGRKGVEFFVSHISFLPRHSPKGVKTKLIDRYVLVYDKKKEGYYAFHLYTDADYYVEANKVFDEMLKNVKLLK